MQVRTRCIQEKNACYFSPKSFSAVRVAVSSAYPDNKVHNKTINRRSSLEVTIIAEGYQNPLTLLMLLLEENYSNWSFQHNGASADTGNTTVSPQEFFAKHITGWGL